MNLDFTIEIANKYKNNSQKTRVLTESWVRDNMYCPICGEPILRQCNANRPVADFYCDKCDSDFELKSREQKAFSSNIIPDGAYDKMIERISSTNNPNLFVMEYLNQRVTNLIFIPKFFFVPSIIIKRPPLKETARRKGWIGCNINIGSIPNDAKIIIIKNGIETPVNYVINSYNRIRLLKTDKIPARGWLFDTMACIDKIEHEYFSLNELYGFESILKLNHPENNFIKAKIRQQLQILRDKGFIEFLGNGKYRKLKL